MFRLATQSREESAGANTGLLAERGLSQEFSPTTSAEVPVKFEPILYSQRWVQLAILACLALVSDLVCFSMAASPESWTRAYGHNPTNLVDVFLFTNVMSCFLVTDLTRLFGLRTVITGASLLMTAGCVLRSHGLFFLSPSDLPSGVLPPYTLELLGTVLVGAAQPFFQCTPPLLSATWFGAKERALATAVAINFNQVGIGSAFMIGGVMGTTPEGIHSYFTLISLASIALSVATYLQFQERPPTPPSSSAAAAASRGDEKESTADHRTATNQPAFSSGGGSGSGGGGGGSGPFFTFPNNAAALFRKPGFLMPLAAFVTSIGVTNAVSAFTDNSLQRAGIFAQSSVNLSGAGFQLAIVAGGILIGGYVDKTKEYKEVTLACLSITLGLLILLGLAEGFDLSLPHWVVVTALLGLGAAAGPVQPINAELAVEVSYPADETSIEAAQQLCGNLFSALLVPLCEFAASRDYIVLPGVGPNEDIRGDSLVLVVLTFATALYFTSFNAPLKRSEFDNDD